MSFKYIYNNEVIIMVDLIRKFLSVKYGQVIIDNTVNADELMSKEI